MGIECMQCVCAAPPLHACTHCSHTTTATNNNNHSNNNNNNNNVLTTANHKDDYGNGHDRGNNIHMNIIYDKKTLCSYN